MDKKGSRRSTDDDKFLKRHDVTKRSALSDLWTRCTRRSDVIRLRYPTRARRFDWLLAGLVICTLIGFWRSIDLSWMLGDRSSAKLNAKKRHAMYSTPLPFQAPSHIPSHISHQITYSLNSPDVCRHLPGGEVFLLNVVISSSPRHRERARVRASWAQPNIHLAGTVVRTVFVVTPSENNKDVDDALRMEANLFGDIIQGQIKDTIEKGPASLAAPKSWHDSVVSDAASRKLSAYEDSSFVKSELSGGSLDLRESSADGIPIAPFLRKILSVSNASKEETAKPPAAKPPAEKPPAEKPPAKTKETKGKTERQLATLADNLGLVALAWIAEFCGGARFVVKADEEAFVNVYGLVKHLKELDAHGYRHRLLMCNVQERSTMFSLYPNDEPAVNTTLRHCHKLGYVLSADVAATLYQASSYAKHYSTDDSDFYLTAILPELINSDFHPSLGPPASSSSHHATSDDSLVGQSGAAAGQSAAINVVRMDAAYLTEREISGVMHETEWYKYLFVRVGGYATKSFVRAWQVLGENAARRVAPARSGDAVRPGLLAEEYVPRARLVVRHLG